jgi:pimeloyl-ACP methyl ester carboxylesterase
MQIESNGSTFHCRIDGQGPWITLSHGLATDLTMWDELTEALKDRYRVLRYDARGHGGSAARQAPWRRSTIRPLALKEPDRRADCGEHLFISVGLDYFHAELHGGQ